MFTIPPGRAARQRRTSRDAIDPQRPKTQGCGRGTFELITGPVASRQKRPANATDRSAVRQVGGARDTENRYPLYRQESLSLAASNRHNVEIRSWVREDI